MLEGGCFQTQEHMRTQSRILRCFKSIIYIVVDSGMREGEGKCCACHPARMELTIYHTAITFQAMELVPEGKSEGAEWTSRFLQVKEVHRVS